jgi:hypothetical protein
MDASTCLPATFFDYMSKAAKMNPDLEGYGKQNVTVAWNGISSWMVDLNKDGLPENLTMQNGTKNRDFYVMVNEKGKLKSASEHSWGKCSEEAGSGGKAMWIVDMNGDGYPDVLYRDKDLNLHLLPNEGGQKFGGDRIIGKLEGSLLGSGKEWPEDIDGDGLVDFLYLTKSDSSAIGSEVKVFLNRTSGFQHYSYGSVDVSNSDLVWISDMNGDRLPDIVARKKTKIEITVQENKVGFRKNYFPIVWNETFELLEPLNPGSTEWFIDVNSDGLVDYVYQSKTKDGSGRYIIKVVHNRVRGNMHFPNPNPFPMTIPYAEEQKDFGSAEAAVAGYRSQWWGDVDGDNDVDYMYLEGGEKRFITLINRNGSYLERQDWGSNAQGNLAWSGETQWLTDIDGDGNADYLYLENNTRIIRGITSTGQKPDLLIKISDGLKQEKLINYESLAKNESVYQVGNHSYPFQDVTSSLYVVSTYTEYDEAAQEKYIRLFRYSNGIADVSGRGWLGFSERVSKDIYAGVEEILDIVSIHII